MHFALHSLRALSRLVYQVLSCPARQLSWREPARTLPAAGGILHGVGRLPVTIHRYAFGTPILNCTLLALLSQAASGGRGASPLVRFRYTSPQLRFFLTVKCTLLSQAAFEGPGRVALAPRAF